jgi:hypothetical protein
MALYQGKPGSSLLEAMTEAVAQGICAPDPIHRRAAD